MLSRAILLSSVLASRCLSLEQLKDEADMQPYSLTNSHSTDNSDLDEGITGALIWFVVVVEIILMGSLAIICSMFLHAACKKKRKAASFIKKLLILVLLVSVAGIINAIHEAPWWKHSRYFDTVWSIVVVCAFEFIYWVAAQWSTWIIAF